MMAAMAATCICQACVSTAHVPSHAATGELSAAIDGSLAGIHNHRINRIVTIIARCQLVAPPVPGVQCRARAVAWV